MLEILIEYRTAAQIFASWVICISALRWGGGPEKATAIIWLFVFELVHRGYHLFLNPVFQVDQFDTFHASLDLIAAIGFVGVALYANRFYTLWIASFQLIAFSAHLARLVADEISPIAYAFLVIAPSWFQIIIMLTGLVAHVQRKKSYGEYRDWRNSDFGAASRIAGQAR